MLASTFLIETGVSKSLLTHVSQSMKHIPMQYQDLFSYYKFLRWQNSYALAAAEDGKITRHGIDFIVIYLTPRGRLIELDEEEQLNLSFRSAIPEAGIPPYVLIWSN